jgi:hypothetical protein
MLEISTLRDLFTQKFDSVQQSLTRRAIHDSPIVETLVKGLNNRGESDGATLVFLTVMFGEREVVFATSCNFTQKVCSMSFYDRMLIRLWFGSMG